MKVHFIYFFSKGGNAHNNNNSVNTCMHHREIAVDILT